MSTLTSLIGGGAGGGSGISSQDYTASGSIAANVPVVVSGDGLAIEAQGTSSSQAGFQVGTVESTNIYYYPVDLAMNSSNTIGVTISEKTTYQTQVALTVWFHDTATGVWTYKSYSYLDTGTRLSSGNGRIQYDAANDCFVALWINSSDYEARIAKITVNASNGSITNISTVLVDSGSSYDRISLSKDDNGNIVAWVANASSANTLKSWVVDASGSSIALSDAKTVTCLNIQNVYYPYNIQYDAETSSYFIAYKYRDDLYFYTYDRTANTATSSIENNIYATTNADGLRPMRVGDKIVFYPAQGLDYAAEAVVADYDSATGSLSNITANALENYTGAYSHFVDDYGVLHLAGQMLGDAVEYKEVSFASIVIEADNTFNVASSSQVTGDARSTSSKGIYTDGSKFYVIYSMGVTSPYYQKAFTYAPEQSSLLTNTYVGISENAASDGQTVTVTTKGNVATTAVNLKSMADYYLTAEGSLTTTGGDNVYAGQAIGTNSLYVLSSLTTTASPKNGVFIPESIVKGYANGVAVGATQLTIKAPAGKCVKITNITPPGASDVRYVNGWLNGVRVFGDGGDYTYLKATDTTVSSTRWAIHPTGDGYGYQDYQLTELWLFDGDVFEVKLESSSDYSQIAYSYQVGTIK